MCVLQWYETCSYTCGHIVYKREGNHNCWANLNKLLVPVKQKRKVYLWRNYSFPSRDVRGNIFCSCTCTDIINSRRACAARVTVLGLSVCLSVCRRLFWHYRLRGGLLAIPAARELREPEN